jgi:hypothetical protein
VIHIFLWGLPIQVKKLPLMPYTSLATKCNQTAPCYLPNFVDIVILITLNVGTTILVFFKPKLEALNNSLSPMVQSSGRDNKSTTEVSYTVNYRIVIVGEAHTFEETLIKPCAMEVATCVLGEQSKKKLF